MLHQAEPEPYRANLTNPQAGNAFQKASLSGSKGRLTLATRQPQARWGEPRFSWRGRKTPEFDDLHLAELVNSVNSALRVIDERDHLLEKVHADCN